MIGNQGTGHFTQNGGTNAVASALSVGRAGVYTFLNGTLTAASESIGGDGAAIFNVAASFSQQGGTNTVGSLTVGVASVGSGFYGLFDGSLKATDENLVSGTIFHAGGSNTVTGRLTINGGATYSLSGGSLGVPEEVIEGAGALVQAAGTHTISSFLHVGGGTYTFFGGALTAPAEVIGSAQATGTFYQTGGTNTIGNGGSLLINGNGSVYGLDGGTLNAPNGAGQFQSYGSFSMAGTGVENGWLQSFGVFTYASGTFNGTLENNGTASINGVFTAGGGIINTSVISVATNFSAYAGGSGFDNEGEVNIANSTIGGISMVNNGLISGYGTINGAAFTNNGLVTQGAGNLTLSATGVNQNFGNINLASGRQFRLTGSGLVNGGSLVLNGAIVAGTATLHNAAGGVLTGPGTITAHLANEAGGVVQIGSGTLNVTLAFANAGLISLTGVTANLTGAGVTNTGTIQGVGNVGSTSLTNNGIVEAIGGTLAVNGTLTNPASGQIFAGTGGKVLVSQGLATNAGLINVSGGTFDNNNHVLTNTGQISGYGALRTSGLTNAKTLATPATITLTGGGTTVSGNVTNGTNTGVVATAATGIINLQYNPATFTGNVVNYGTINITNTTVTWAGGFTNNGNVNVTGGGSSLINSTVETGSGTVTKNGTGTLTLNGAQGYATLLANAGTTNVNGMFTTGGTSHVVANANIHFGSVSQTLASLSIGAGATVTFSSGLASFTDSGGSKAQSFGGTTGVPEPGSAGLLAAAALALLARRRRGARRSGNE